MFFLYVVFFELLMAVTMQAMQEKECPLSPTDKPTLFKEHAKEIRQKTITAQEDNNPDAAHKLTNKLRYWKNQKWQLKRK